MKLTASITNNDQNNMHQKTTASRPIRTTNFHPITVRIERQRDLIMEEIYRIHITLLY